MQTTFQRLGAPLGPPSVQTFSRDADRERLSATALKAYKRITQAWVLSPADAAGLLDVTVRTWNRYEGRQSVALRQDQLTRISALAGIYKGLNLLLSSPLANEWPTRENDGFLYRGHTPVHAMLEGGIPKMLDVRRHIDGARGGL